MRILLDTNILLRAVEPRHVQHEVCWRAVEILRSGGHELVIAPQVLYEFWSVATRPIENNGLGMSPLDAHLQIRAIQNLFRLLRDERAIYGVWLRLVSSLEIRGKKAHDARLAAAMERHAVDCILTFNATDFARFSFVKALTPEAVISEQANA